MRNTLYLLPELLTYSHRTVYIETFHFVHFMSNSHYYSKTVPIRAIRSIKFRYMSFDNINRKRPIKKKLGNVCPVNLSN